MSVKITTDENQGSVNVGISGFGSLIAWSTILLAAKFSKPFSIDKLLSPIINDQLVCIDIELKKFDFMLSSRGGHFINEDDIVEIRRIIRSSRSIVSPDDSFDNCEFRAFFPFIVVDLN